VTVPHYVSEDKSDMRGIKLGWYVIEDAGNISSGPFSSHQECVKRITQPPNGTMASSCNKDRIETLSTEQETLGAYNEIPTTA
jgi:hypothetical protein